MWDQGQKGIHVLVLGEYLYVFACPLYTYMYNAQFLQVIHDMCN